MVLSLLMVLALVWQCYLGYSRGLAKQVYLVFALLVSFVLAQLNYLGLADRLTLWVPYTQAVEEKALPYFAEVSIFEMDKVFYAGVAFLIIFLGCYLVLRFLSLLLHLFPLEKLDNPLLNGISGLLSVLVTLIFWGTTVKLLATLPFDQVQEVLTQNLFIKGLLHFPLLSDLLHQLWVVKGL